MVQKKPRYLSRLVRELTDTLRVIAYTEMVGDLDFIRERQADLRKDYGSRIGLDDSLQPQDHPVKQAYALFMDILAGNKNSDDISYVCQDILTDCLGRYT